MSSPKKRPLSSTPSTPKKQKSTDDVKEVAFCKGYESYAHATNCTCVKVDRETLHAHLAVHAVDEQLTFNDPTIKMLRKQGVIPCIPCCRKLQKIVRDRDEDDESTNIKWILVLMNWWHWTPEQKRWAPVFVQLMQANIGLMKDDYNTRECYDDTLSVVHDAKGVGCIDVGLKVYQCILKADVIADYSGYDEWDEDEENEPSDDEEDEEEEEEEEEDEEPYSKRTIAASGTKEKPIEP
jgi:hypothetical protein